MTLKNEVAKLNTGVIPAQAAISPSVRDFERQKVVISFEAYKQSHCRLHKLDKPEAKHLTSELRKMTSTVEQHFRHQHMSRIACKQVHKGGEYSPLFTDLPEDAELLEVDYTGPGRIFGFLVENVFNVVTIAKEHLR